MEKQKAGDVFDCEQERSPLPFDVSRGIGDVERSKRGDGRRRPFEYAGPESETGVPYEEIADRVAASPEIFTLQYLYRFYNKLIETHGDRSDFVQFRTRKQYCAMRNTILGYAKATGHLEEMEEYIRKREPKVLDAFLYGKGLQGHRSRPAEEFDDAEAEFLWDPYLPLGEYTVLMAPGGMGKTYLTCGLAAALTQGRTPMNGGETEEKKNVLFISAEDRGGELKHRLKVCGADLRYTHIVDCGMSVDLSLSDRPEEFLKLIETVGASLVVIDPWQAFVSKGVDLNRINHLRPVLQKVSLLAKQARCAIVLISHVGKRLPTENVNNAAIGSTDLINAARSALYLTFGETPEERLLVHTKSNYAAMGDSLRFSISKENGVQWLGRSKIGRMELEALLRSGKSPCDHLREQRIRNEELQTLLSKLRLLAEPGKRVRVPYDRLRDEYGEDIFCGMRPRDAIEQALALAPTSGLHALTGLTMNRKDPETGRWKTSKCFDLMMD